MHISDLETTKTGPLHGVSAKKGISDIDRDRDSLVTSSPLLRWSEIKRTISHVQSTVKENPRLSVVGGTLAIVALVLGRVYTTKLGVVAGAGVGKGAGASSSASRTRAKAAIEGGVGRLFTEGKRTAMGIRATREASKHKNLLGQTADVFRAIRDGVKGLVTSSSDPVTTTSNISGGEEVFAEMRKAWTRLYDSMQGSKLDALLPLLVTSAVIPAFKLMNVSPILGFLVAGTILGPSGLNWVADVHALDHLGEIGIVFFLFEMGLELSIDKLKSMKKDVFGLGLSQFLLSTAVIAAVARGFGLPVGAAATVGGSLALSSSAFVLQLLKDKGAMGTRHGKASFGILLLQDLAVVPLLIIVELLGHGGAGLGKALLIAASKAVITLSTMSVLGKKLFDPIFYMVSRSQSQEAFLSITLCVVLLMSFVTQGIGLSGTLGAFLAGLLLAETRYSYQIEADIKPFRGILLGFFFITVGFSIDLTLLQLMPKKIIMLTALLMSSKAAIVTLLSWLNGLTFSAAQHTGLLLSQGGEFAFVAFGMARKVGLLTEAQTRLLLTVTALSMALTPLMAEMGTTISNRIEQASGFAHYIGTGPGSLEEKIELTKTDFVVVCGYGRVGKMVCDVLDRKFIRYIAIDNSPQRAIDARNKGLPVFYGDINRPEILSSFHTGSAKACVLTMDNMSTTNRAVISLRKNFPDLSLIVRAKDMDHKQRLEKKFKRDEVQVICPVIPEDSVLLSLPFGGAVLQKLGVAPPEINLLLEETRREAMAGMTVEAVDFLDSLSLGGGRGGGGGVSEEKPRAGE